MAIGERKQGKTLSGRANRVQPEIQMPIATVALRHLASELERLEELYAETYQPPKGREPKSTETKLAWTRSRNHAICTQLELIKRLAQQASGCVHPTGHNTMEEKEAAADLVAKMTARAEAKLGGDYGDGVEQVKATASNAPDS